MPARSPAEQLAYTIKLVKFNCGVEDDAKAQVIAEYAIAHKCGVWHAHSVISQIPCICGNCAPNMKWPDFFLT